MNPDTLINPVFIYWDIGASFSDDKDISRICEELVNAKIFVLNLRDLSVPLSSDALIILKRLSGSQIKVNLSMKRRGLEESLDIIKHAAAAKLYTALDSHEELENALGTIKQINIEGGSVGVSFELNKNNLKDVPELLSMCIDNQIKDITIPIRRYDEKNIFYPDAEDSTWLADQLKTIDLSNMHLNIHDPFLWKLLYSKENPNEEGCNGAKTMMYINKNLEVTPCPIFPFNMGSLRNSSLKEIFSSEKRRQVRKEMSVSPPECKECHIRNQCKGGCRGRAFTLFNGFDKKDPACLSEIRQ